MTLPIPSGTRDVLPDEMRERRGVIEALRGVFAERGYGEVATPAVEFADDLERAGIDPTGDAARPRFRTIDEHGRTLVLRSDMTVPIARLVGSRLTEAPVPVRLSYVAHCYRGILPGRGEARELLQAGIELCGASAPDGTAEALSVLAGALRAVGLTDARIAVGDASLFPALLERFAVEAPARRRILGELVTRDHVGLERELAAGVDPRAADLLLRVARHRTDAGSVMNDIRELDDARIVEAANGLATLVERIDPDVAEQIVFDLGLVRGIGYYTGAVFEVYVPGQGHAIGGGGRYDELLGRFGRPLPAVGFALDVDALHTALVGTARGRWRVRPELATDPGEGA